MRVLIADDDPVYRSLLEGLLRQWEFDVVVVCDGSEAWQALQSRGDVQLAILDWMMPEMDGYEVCARIKQDRSKEHIYVIMVTGSARRDDIIRVLVAGADDYIIKPFEPLDLKIRVHAAKRIVDLQAELVALER